MRRYVVRRLIECLLATLLLGIAAGRLSGVMHLVASALAPYTCVVCRGCPVEHAHEVCDCTACEEVAAGMASSSPSIHDIHHGGGALVADGFADDPALDPAVAPWPLPVAAARLLSLPLQLTWLPAPPLEPLDPPPRA